MQYGNKNKIFREQETPGVILGAKEIFDFVDSRYCIQKIITNRAINSYRFLRAHMLGYRTFQSYEVFLSCIAKLQLNSCL
jgi:hypothetical protein